MRVFRWILAVLAPVVILAVVLAFVFDYNDLKRPLTAWAGERIGRALAVDGPLSVEFGRTLRVSAQDLRLGNAAWGSRPDMASARRIVVELDTWSLIDRPVLIRRIEVEDFDLLLERTADGNNNWQFRADDEPSAWKGSLPVVVDSVRMPNARVQFIGPRLTRPLDVRFERLEQKRGGDNMLRLSGAGRANETDLNLTVRAGPFDALVEGRNFTASVDGRLGEVSVSGEARVDDLARPVNTEIDFRLEGADAEYLASRLGVRNLGAGPLDLTGRIAPAGNQQGVQGSLSGRLGAFAIQASGTLTDPAEMKQLAIRLDVAGPDLSLLGGIAGMAHLPAESFRLQADVKRVGAVVDVAQLDLDLPDSSLRLRGSVKQVDTLAGTDLDLDIKGSDIAKFRELLNIYGVATGPFELKAKLRQSDRGVETIDLKARTSLGDVALAGPLGAYPDYYGTRLRFDLVGTELARIGKALGADGLPAGPFAAGGEFEWTRDGIVFRNSTLRTGPDRLTLDGRIARKPLGPGTDLQFRIAGPNLAQVAGEIRLPAAAYDLQGRLRRQRGASRLDDVRGTVAGARIRMKGLVADTLPNGSDIDFQIDGPALQAFAAAVPGYALPEGPFRAAGGLKLAADALAVRDLEFSAAGTDGRIEADIRLPMSAASGSFDIAARGPDLARWLPASARRASLAASFDLKARGRVTAGKWHFDEAKLATAAGSVGISGDLDWSPDFSATALHLDAAAPDLAQAAALFGVEAPALRLQLVADFSGTATAFRMSRLTAKIGDSDFSGRLSLALQGKKPELELDLRSEFLDVTALRGGGEPSAAQPGKRAGGRVIPDSPLPMHLLDRVDGRFAVSATRARIADSAFRDLKLNARLRDGGLTLEPLEVQGPLGGKFEFRGEVLPGPDGAHMNLSVTARQAVLSLWSDKSVEAATRPKVDVDIQLAGRGRTWRELAATLDGRLRLVAGAGVAPGTGLELLLGNLWRELIGTVVRSANSRTIKLRCLALVADAAGGVVTTAPVLAVQTENVNVISRGKLDLRNETTEFYMKTTPRSRLGVSAGEIINPYVKITGPMNAPRLAVDPKGTFFSGATAVATGGLSILARGAWDRLFRADDPCAAALAESERLVAQPEKKRRFPGLSR